MLNAITTLTENIHALKNDQSVATAIEYGLIAAGVAIVIAGIVIVIISALTLVSGSLTDMFTIVSGTS
jgi:Flp pilus assembly pilin Flp